MKKIVHIALAALMALSLTACGGGDDQEQVNTAFSVEVLMEDMLGQVTIQDPFELSETDMLDFFGVRADQMEEFAAITCLNGLTAQEIILVKAPDEEAAQSVAEKLEDRLSARAAELENYLPEEHAVVAQCEVFQDGPYAALIIHPEHEKLEELYQLYLKGEN